MPLFSKEEAEKFKKDMGEHIEMLTRTGKLSEKYLNEIIAINLSKIEWVHWNSIDCSIKKTLTVEEIRGE